jgi:alanine dehydrogenase
MTSDLLWITEQDVAATVGLDAAIVRLREWLIDEDTGNAESISKAMGTWEPRSSVHALGAVSTKTGMASFKTWVNTPQGAAAILTLFDAQRGRVLAVLEAGTVGFLRTAAMNGVATDHLASPEATSMAIIGSGRQAIQQVAAVRAVRPLDSVRVHSPTAEHRESFARRITEEFGIAASAVPTIEEAVSGQPIVTVITRAREPILTAAQLAAGAHVNAAGAILPGNAELAPDVLQRSSLTVADSVENARRASRELIDLDRWDEVVPLHRVVAGAVTRPPAPDHTVFKGMGMGLFDLAVASLAYERAREQGLGRAIPVAVPATPRWVTPEPISIPTLSERTFRGH